MNGSTTHTSGALDNDCNVEAQRNISSRPLVGHRYED